MKNKDGENIIKTEQYKYVIFDIDNKIIQTFNDETKPNFYALSDSLIENVTITFYEHNYFEIIGDEICYEYDKSHKIEDIDDECIIEIKPFFFSKKKIKVIKNTWYSLKKRNPFKIYIHNVTIIYNMCNKFK